ncbi:glycoside hydrolase family 32 protein [Actinoplanes subtropicus]|uniref:glycoside hydrolase family 32 protein n=1 Tax=Actinoplanes subtropicus TaxID=543632 RepID=UPI00068B5941|nr:glycoside hydrolase family 32 protein [Actinoplanes subtropicus]
MSTDPHLPAVHLRPPRNWVNDPNGLVFHDGFYHVFFQYNPNGPEHRDVHWGHFRSRDLVRWELLPVALAPTPGGDDADGCWSGNAISDDGRILAFYSARRDDRWWQPVTTAESRDGGHTWAKRPLPLLAQPPAGTTMFRDPYVWRQGGRWRMLVGSALADGRGAAFLYESPDLRSWAPRGPLHTGPTGWECPQYATFGDRGLLIVSQWHPERGPQNVVAYPGRERDGRLAGAEPVPLDHGPDFYAPALLPAPDGRWLLWGWTPEARSGDWVHEAGWAGALTVPREVTLTADGAVHQRPARELLALRARRIVHRTGPAGDLGEVGPAFDLTATLTAGAGLRLDTSPDGTEHLDIRWDAASGRLLVDRDHASRDPRAARGSYALPCPSADDLRIIVDGSIAEVYLSSGRVLTLRFYPTGRAPWRLSATGPGHVTAEAWELRGPVVSEACQSGDRAAADRCTHEFSD